MADLQTLAAVFSQTLAPQKEIIQAAEAQLKTLSAQPGYSVKVLQLLANPALEEAVRQAAAVSFKNTIKYRWVVSDEDAFEQKTALPDAEKAEIKTQLLNIMLNTPARIRAQLSEAMALICNHDFPQGWPTLLPELVSRLNGADLATIHGVLVTANSIFKRYRNQYRSDAMVAELAASQEMFAPKLLEVQKQLQAQLAATQDVDTLKSILSSVRLSFRIFFSFNAAGVTPLMESQLDDWMASFHAFLALPDNPALAERDPSKESVLDAVRCAVCNNINLYMEMNEEDFVKYLQTFATDVWQLLLVVSRGNRHGQDNLAMAGMRFLTTISRSCHYNLFADANTLRDIVTSIVLPNLQVRDDDEEMFDNNPVEYIRRDAEGSDSDTRRRIAADLVKSLTEKFPTEVTQLCIVEVQRLLGEYAASPATHWKSKDCAIYLVLAMTVRGKTASKGATSTNQLVNIEDFFNSQVLPELRSPQLNNVPVLKADAMKFVTTFRSVLPKAALLEALPHLVQLLTSESCVVHSYAASAIDKLLAAKEGGVQRFSPSDIAPYLQALLTNLFNGFKHPESAENEYLMRAVTRVIGFVGVGIAPVAAHALKSLADMLLEVCKNPRNPGFNHYLFEAVAALIRTVGASDMNQVVTFEQLLFPAFQTVLAQDVQEFHPYVFQIFAQLIELRTSPLPAVYLQIFPPLVLPQFWERSGNIPALVRLMQAYLLKASNEIVPPSPGAGHLIPLLGVFQKLIASKAHDHEGFHILCSIVENVPFDRYEAHFTQILNLLFNRLQHSNTPKFTRNLLVFLATFIIKHGPSAMMTQLEKIQAGMTAMIMQQIWLPNMSSLSGSDEKLVLVATARCLTDLQPLKANPQLWTGLKDAAYKQLEAGRAQNAAALPVNNEDEAELEEAPGYVAAYAQLANAARPARAVLAEIPDPKQFLDASLASVVPR